MGRLFVYVTVLWSIMAVGGAADCHGPVDSEPYGYGFRKCRQQFGGENWTGPSIWLGIKDLE